MSEKKTNTKKTNTKKIRFRQFLELHASLMPAVQHTPGSPAFYDLMRLWNTIALLFPERCDDILVYPVGELPKAMPNDLKLTEALKTLEGRPLDNLPEELRSTGYQDRKKMDEANGELKKEKAIQRQIEGVGNTQPDPPTPTEPEPTLPKDDEDDKDVTVPSHAKDKKVKALNKPN